MHTDLAQAQYYMDQRAIDNTAPPANVITPGSTWYFQYWYRDKPIFGTNFTDGISVCFAP